MLLNTNNKQSSHNPLGASVVGVYDILWKVVDAGHQDLAGVGQADLSLALEVIQDGRGVYMVGSLLLEIDILLLELLILLQLDLDCLLLEKCFLLLFRDFASGPSPLLADPQHLKAYTFGYYN